MQILSERLRERLADGNFIENENRASQKLLILKLQACDLFRSSKYHKSRVLADHFVCGQLRSADCAAQDVTFDSFYRSIRDRYGEGDCKTIRYLSEEQKIKETIKKAKESKYNSFFLYGKIRDLCVFTRFSARPWHIPMAVQRTYFLAYTEYGGEKDLRTSRFAADEARCVRSIPFFFLFLFWTQSNMKG